MSIHIVMRAEFYVHVKPEFKSLARFERWPAHL